MRLKSSTSIRSIVLVGGWTAVAFIVSIGPLAIQTKSKGPYFGPSGYWCVSFFNYIHVTSEVPSRCWITDAYPLEQTFLEYFFVSSRASFYHTAYLTEVIQEWVSSGLSFLLYVGILLRVRGNLVHTESGWHLRFVPRSQRWKLAINRDWLDSSMLHVAARLLWYPVRVIQTVLCVIRPHS